MRGRHHTITGIAEDLEGSSFMGFMDTAFLNTANWDRFLRVGAGLVMLWLGWHLSEGVLASALRVFALYPLISGLAGWCPIYALLELSTRRRS